MFVIQWSTVKTGHLKNLGTNKSSQYVSYVEREGDDEVQGSFQIGGTQSGGLNFWGRTHRT